MTPSLEVDLCGVRLPTPVLAASGCFGFGREMASFLDLAQIGAVVTKSVSLEPRRGRPTPRMAETPSGMLNAIGLQNPGVEAFCREDLPVLGDAGADGLTLINTLLGMAVDVRRLRPKLAAVTGGLSGPAIRPIAVRCVWQVARAMPEVPIVGAGGVVTGEDAAELLLAGAVAVQVGTANFITPRATAEVAEGLRAYLESQRLTSVTELPALLKADP